MQEGEHVQPLVIGGGDCRQLVSWCEGVSCSILPSAAVLQCCRPQVSPSRVLSVLWRGSCRNSPTSMSPYCWASVSSCSRGQQRVQIIIVTR